MDGDYNGTSNVSTSTIIHGMISVYYNAIATPTAINLHVDASCHVFSLRLCS